MPIGVSTAPVIDVCRSGATTVTFGHFFLKIFRLTTQIFDFFFFLKKNL